MTVTVYSDTLLLYRDNYKTPPPPSSCPKWAEAALGQLQRAVELRAEDAPHLGLELLGEHGDRSAGRRPRRRGQNETSQAFGPRRPSPRVACHGDSSPAVELRLIKHEGFSLAMRSTSFTRSALIHRAGLAVLDMRSRDTLPVSGPGHARPAQAHKNM